MRVLISSGGTEEAIDGVRRISNTSTGKTGAVLAGEFAARGAGVRLLRNRRAVPPPEGVEDRTFVSYEDLVRALKISLSEDIWDAVIHLAAVSDYTVDTVEVDGRAFPPGGPGKIGTGKKVTLTLKPTAKILDSLKSWYGESDLTVVGFKLTDGADQAEREAKVREILNRGGTDYVVHNDLREITEDRHPATLWSKAGLLEKTETKNAMAAALYALLAGEQQ